MRRGTAAAWMPCVCRPYGAWNDFWRLDFYKYFAPLGLGAPLPVSESSVPPLPINGIDGKGERSSWFVEVYKNSNAEAGGTFSFQAGEIWVEGERRGGFGFVLDQVEHRHAQRGDVIYGHWGPK